MSGQKPGLLILDMSNDQMNGVQYNKAAVVSNVAQLAASEFFQVSVVSTEEVPAFRAKQRGAKLPDELVNFDHFKALPKKLDSALSNPEVLETFKNAGVTHVCICGTSTDTSVYATAKDLIENGFKIFVVKDGTTSKNGRFGHDKGIRKIESEFGDECVVGIVDLLGEEEVVKDPEHANAPASAQGASRMTDAERLAARKKQVDEARFAHIKQANAIALTNADEKRAAEIRKDSVEAETFTQNLPQNKAPPVPEASSAQDLPQSKTPQLPKSSPPQTVDQNNAHAAPKGSSAPALPAPAKKGFLGGLFCCGAKNPEDPDPAPSAASESSARALAPTPKSAPAPAPQPAPVPTPKPIPAAMPKTEPTPTPKTEPTPMPKTESSLAPTPSHSATSVPGGGAGQTTWIKPKPEGAKTTSYTPDGAVSQPLGVKKMVQGNDVQHRIAGLQADGISTVPMGPRKMKTPKVVTDTKETWDKQGNITREITRYITEIDGTKRTEKEIVKIPAKE